MTTDDYKELILLRLIDADTSNRKYAAVDLNGDLCLYRSKPLITPLNNKLWTPLEELDGTTDTVDSHYSFVDRFPSLIHPYWDKVLVKLQ